MSCNQEGEEGEWIDEGGGSEEEEGSWEEQIMSAPTTTGGQIVGLPQGLRIRSAAHKKSSSENAAALVTEHLDGLRPTGRREVWALGVFFGVSLLMTAHFAYQWLLPGSPAVESWRRGCRQCRHDWWDEFWRWRLKVIEAKDGAGEGSQPHTPPEGMEWEWGRSINDTDWYGASPELVSSVIQVYADPALGPVLQIGCGDSPLPGLLHQAGFNTSEHLDVAPQVITAMQLRYPPKEWPGMQFRLRDFLASGAPPPAHRFSAVIDKAGIWDWLQDEAPKELPRLLRAVRKALIPGTQQPGVYIIATKQNPSELSATFSRIAAVGPSSGPGFVVEATHPLGSSGIAWAYVLTPF